MIVDQKFMVERKGDNGFEYEAQLGDRREAEILKARVERETGRECRIVTVTSTVDDDQTEKQQRLAQLFREYVAMTTNDEEMPPPRTPQELKQMLRHVNGKAISIVEQILADTDLYQLIRDRG